MHIKKTQYFWILLLVLVLAGAGLLAPVKAQEEGDTPRAFAVVPDTPIQVIEIPVSAERDTPPAFTVPPNTPLQITKITVSPQPYIGQAVTLHIEVMSTENEPDAAILVDLPKGVELVKGELLWQGALKANQVQSYEVTIRVLEEGDWRLWIAAQSQIAENSFYGDTETLHLISTADGVRVVPGSEYRIIQPPEGMPMPEIPPENVSVTVDLSARAVTTGTVIFEGDFKFDAREYDGGINPPYLVTNALKRVKIEVWDYETTGDRRLDVMTYTPGAGYSATVANNDPDGSGIDPFLKIYVTDEERVEVVDEANHLYSMPFNLYSYIGDDLADGTYSLNITFPEDDFTQALYIFDKTADDAYEFLQREVTWGNTDMIQVNWPDGCLGNDDWSSCFTGTQIFITDASGDEPDVIIHEYGHFVLSRDVPVLWVVNACLYEIPPYHHYMWKESSHTCAWSEGWANFFEMAVQNDPNYIGLSLEDVDTQLGSITGDPASYEGVIAASLWDIFDDVSPGTEVWDYFRDGFNGDDSNNTPTGNGIWHFSRNSFGSSSDFWIGPVWDNWRDNRPDGACYGSIILQHHLLAYPPYTHTLTTSISPPGAGDIQFDPPPNCPQDTYQEDTTVTLKAIPKTGYILLQMVSLARGRLQLDPRDRDTHDPGLERPGRIRNPNTRIHSNVHTNQHPHFHIYTDQYAHSDCNAYPRRGARFLSRWHHRLVLQ